MPNCRVVDPKDLDWQDQNRPNIPWPGTIIYEAYVKGFSQLNPAIPKELRGTFEGMGHRASIDYIKSLGMTSVELMPVHEFPDDQHLLDKGLKKLWGYNTIGFFSPALRYYGPRGIRGDNFSYYRTMPEQHRYYINDTGTGNTVNTSHPRMLQLIMGSLRYWAETMHIDGFRFDQAPSSAASLTASTSAAGSSTQSAKIRSFRAQS